MSVICYVQTTCCLLAQILVVLTMSVYVPLLGALCDLCDLIYGLLRCPFGQSVALLTQTQCSMVMVIGSIGKISRLGQQRAWSLADVGKGKVNKEPRVIGTISRLPRKTAATTVSGEGKAGAATTAGGKGKVKKEPMVIPSTSDFGRTSFSERRLFQVL